jgi:hypothetical protein
MRVREHPIMPQTAYRSAASAVPRVAVSVGPEWLAVGADDINAVNVEVAGVDEHPHAGTERADVAVQLQIFAGAVGQGDDQGADVGGDACDECPRPKVGGAAVSSDVSSWRYRWTNAAATPGT